MAQFNPTNQTIQVTTGNVRTTVDYPNTSLGQPQPYPSVVFPNYLGSTFWDNAISTANPYGQPTKYRYLKYLSTSNPTLLATPAPVWYTDATMTIVTGKFSESAGGVSFFAGIMMPNTGDLSGLTAALLNANSGAAVWVAVGGIVTGVASAATTAGDMLYANVDWTTTGGLARVAAGGTPLGKTSAYAYAASPGTVYVNAESL